MVATNMISRTGTPSTTAPSLNTGALVVAKPLPKQTPLQRLGTEFISVKVGANGQKQQTFLIHKKLIVDACAAVAEHFETCPAADLYFIPETTVEIFEHVYNYLYSGDIPCLTEQEGTSGESSSAQIEQLVKLYIFAESQGMCFEFRNRIMDEVQDAFARSKSLPPEELIKYIYKHTLAGSKLRKFCSETLLFILQYGKPGAGANLILRNKIQNFLTENEIIFQDFLEVTQYSTRSVVDTRIRSCGKDPRCADCFYGIEHTCDVKIGIFPCWFHYHDGLDFYKEEADGTWTENRISDDCHFNVEVVKDKLRRG